MCPSSNTALSIGVGDAVSDMERFHGGPTRLMLLISAGASHVAVVPTDLRWGKNFDTCSGSGYEVGHHGEEHCNSPQK
jgi:hypothetical protein